ncbi:glucosamine-1-phosphate N-acetyltransferase; UDP-N-acetylglucosamine pyrophosphorylase [Coriobacterium glomerans PW2]|uniref:Bifunctional protein GlmU n=1 Tax=Coriobacterium glomerans (strain ATCC 49209 / DSM 20642 / JCM 10262 / PW2) TaxID=700015 RepID=F2NB79_CORGP|nr:bifunctional UDP-N-acetylglucosamine diphosphorylase/glucosamine-1-phosphate N-acetyltransferase GlmU [Coriobacterium glomerans]AEB07830.1 glucosamine-1-phosphate N-acetyltransferase; UDP-N-acetylglucosamine pyrophosphorylase [Coriobacterium glomerans PW2]
MDITAIILAAGEGTRMRSRHAKVAHEVLGKPMIRWVLDAAVAAGCTRIDVVVGCHGQQVRDLVRGTEAEALADITCVDQPRQLGTADAVRCALDARPVAGEPVVVLNGDLPLISPETIRRFAETVADGSSAAAILTMTPPDPFGYGRIELGRTGAVERIIEQAECTPAQHADMHECNAGCYAFDGAALTAHIGEIGCDNTQSEYYLTDMIEILRRAGLDTAVVHLDDYREGIGVNSRSQLAEMNAMARDRVNARLMDSGVTLIDPTQAWIGPDASIGADTIVYPLTFVTGATCIGEDCVIGPNTRLESTRVGNGCTVEETVAIQAVLENDVSCGPRAYLRPGTHMLEGSKAGTHVEIKKSTIGRGSKVPHLSYIGDTIMGADVNIGAGSITCNYDGVNKNPTTIGDGTFIGSDTMMVAPVNIGAHATTGAGGTITQDVPDGALALERVEQRIIAGYAKRRMRPQHSSEDSTR